MAEATDRSSGDSSPLGAVTVALAVAGIVLTVAGTVRLSGNAGDAIGSSLVQVGAAVVGGAVVAGLLAWAQARIDDARSIREMDRAEKSALALTLATNDNLTGIDLIGRNLAGTYLADKNLSNADMSQANLEGATLQRVDLSGATMTGANLRGANLEDAVLDGADLTGAVLLAAVLPDNARDVTIHDDSTRWPAPRRT